jgi:methylase of polypeptide subunit release factors
VVAVEKQEKARLFFWLNAVVNGMHDRVEFRQGDFVDAVAGERFDHIVCNPPLLPVPRDRPLVPLVRPHHCFVSGAYFAPDQPAAEIKRL